LNLRDKQTKERRATGMLEIEGTKNAIILEIINNKQLSDKEVYLLLENERKPIMLSSPQIKEIPSRYKGKEQLEYIELQKIDLDELIRLNERLRVLVPKDKVSSYRWSTDAVESCDIFVLNTEAYINYNNKLYKVMEIITATMKDKQHLYHQLAFKIY